MARKIRAPFASKDIVVLRALYHLNDKQRKTVLENADKKLISHICECALNVLIGNVPLDKKHKTRLRRHASTL